MVRQTNGKCFAIIKNVCVYWKIIGLSPFVLTGDDTGSTSCVALFYTTMLTMCYGVCYYYAVIYRMRFIMPRETPMIVIADFLGFTTEFLLVITAWIHIVLRHERIQTILKIFEKIHDDSKMINVNQDFSNIFGKIKFWTLVVNLMWFSLYLGDHIFLYDKKTSKLEIWMPFNFPRVVTHNVVIMFVGALWIVKKFFRSLNEKIRTLSTGRTVMRIIPERNWNALKNKGLQSFVRPSPLEAYVRMHSDLVNLTEMIVDYFAMSITFVLLLNVILMDCDIYVWCLMARERKFTNWKHVAVFFELSCWWLIHFAQTLVMIALCDSTANEANRSGSVLHAMLVDCSTKNYIEPVDIFSLRLLQERLKIQLYGLFEIRFPVMHKIIGMVVTYITIMIQLDIQDLEHQHRTK